ncbi:FAD/NAD(P)-binding protein [Pseudonocardia sp. HH130629-09]|uniref:FAD/NAD(P)-binding protein n=1 Tax=Pseudonocardia sp. HH130629-09 TaxID=1641402 RepID=UPI001930E686|nr:FAD/NAD(P)-binding protein [Pseudonocardia sp. HH130629-09]
MGRAVVLGASIAGMLAARVLADHAEEVLLIDPDGDPTGPEPRPGVPQGGQVHALLPAG